MTGQAESSTGCLACLSRIVMVMMVIRRIMVI